MFILFVNDLPMSLDDNADMYADDSSITAQAKTVPELEAKLNFDSEKISNWCIENHMSVNATKTKVALITTRQKRASLPENQRQLHVTMQGVPLENVNSEKILGITINNNLSWEEHINTIVSKINSKLALFRRIKGCLPYVTRKLFFSSHILPYLAPLYGEVHLM